MSMGNGLRLSNQLIKPLLANVTVALLVNVDSVSGAGRLSVDQHAKTHGGALPDWSHDEIQIAGMEAIGYPAVCLVQQADVFPDRPVAGQRPIIKFQLRWRTVNVTLVQYCSAGRCKASIRLISDVGFRRFQSLRQSAAASTPLPLTETTSGPMPVAPASVSSCLMTLSEFSYSPSPK